MGLGEFGDQAVGHPEEAITDLEGGGGGELNGISTS